MMIKRIIKRILSSGLIYAVYTETGMWTAMSVLLIGLGIEIMIVWLKKISNQLEDLRPDYEEGHLGAPPSYL